LERADAILPEKYAIALSETGQRIGLKAKNGYHNVATHPRLELTPLFRGDWPRSSMPMPMPMPIPERDGTASAPASNKRDSAEFPQILALELSFPWRKSRLLASG
jgi:hypothetical protein